MTREWLAWAAILVAVATCRAGVFDASSGGRPKDPKPKAELAAHAGPMCATLGDVGANLGRLRIEDPKVRAVAIGSQGDAAELRFVYEGPTEDAAPLASGEIRRQLGLKLRAEDGCNLVYVMWRIAPRSVVEVQVKQTPGARTHAECGVEGYSNLRPKRRRRVKAPAIGSEHTMRAEIAGEQLTVWIDERIAWQGTLGDDIASLDGPAGLRTDNVRLDAELLVAPGPPDAGRDSPGCRPEDSADAPVEIEITDG